jgi:NitT/TauT family transport system substrate-binding protein
MRHDNPDMTDVEMEASVALMKQLGIVDSGEALAKGIGAMSQARIRDFYAQMVGAGLYQRADVELDKVATDRFVNRGVGLDVKSQLLAR